MRGSSAGSTSDDADASSDEEVPDNELMRRYAEQADVDAFERLVSRHESPLFHYILKQTDGHRAAAEDILQETFVRVVDNAQDYEPSHAFSTWLYTIARNLCVDRSRRASVNRTESLDAPLDDEDSRSRKDRLVASESASAGVEHDREKFRKQLAEALDELPEDQREVFVLREVSGLTFPEISDVVDAAVGTVKSRMRYALQSLRRHLEDFEDISFERAQREATGGVTDKNPEKI